MGSVYGFGINHLSQNPQAISKLLVYFQEVNNHYDLICFLLSTPDYYTEADHPWHAISTYGDPGHPWHAISTYGDPGGLFTPNQHSVSRPAHIASPSLPVNTFARKDAVSSHPMRIQTGVNEAMDTGGDNYFSSISEQKKNECQFG